MATLHIGTTRLQDLQPLAAAGQTATQAWAVLSALLSRELSPAHAALLAEPVENSARGETDWYADGDGPAPPIDTLPPDARAAAEDVLGRLIADIERLAATKRAAGGQGERFLGELLTIATRIPDRASIRVLSGPSGPQPVLMAWGHARTGAGAAPVELMGRAARPQSPMELLPPPAVVARVPASRRWLWPALLAGLLLPLLAWFLLLVDPFRWFVPPAPVCSANPDEMGLLAELREGSQQEAVLRAELARLTDDAGRRRLQCPPRREAAAGGAANTDQQAATDIQRARREGAHGGKLEIILAWEDRNDLDLHVRCPSGEQIFYDHRTACGGTLDVDANANPDRSTDTPAEHVSFADPAPGRYQVVVVAYVMNRAGRTSSPFRVTIHQEGQPDRVVSGVANAGAQRGVVTEVDIAPP
jgi:hypothetical protein